MDDKMESEFVKAASDLVNEISRTNPPLPLSVYDKFAEFRRLTWKAISIREHLGKL